MTFTPKLSPEKERELLVEYQDGWSIKELTLIYRVSARTVYRILAEHEVPKINRRKRKGRVRKPKKPRELKPCGTNAAYQRHRRAGEYPCTPCLEAHSEDVSKARSKKR